MIIRIIGLLGLLVSYAFFNCAYELIKSSSPDNMLYAFSLISFCLGIFFLYYGGLWIIEGYGDGKVKKTSTTITDPKLIGLRGWLVLFGICLVLNLILQPFVTLGLYPTITKIEGWELFKDSHSRLATLLISALLAIQIFYNALVIYLATLFFQKKRAFRNFYFITTLTGISFFLIYSNFSNYITSFANIHPKLFFDLWMNKGGFVTIICMFYMGFSKRVQATFVN